jgi:hypothetical protein
VTGHDYEWALGQLKEGGTVRRAHWDKGVYAAIAPNGVVETRRVGELDPISTAVLEDFTAANRHAPHDWEDANTTVFREIE